jgi:glycosyltransferase involved in cell wall biosynthesis
LATKPYIGGVVLNNKISGSTRRIFELFNLFAKKNYKTTIYTYDGVPPEWIKCESPLRPFEYLEFEYPHVLICATYEDYQLIEDYDAKLKIVFLHNSKYIKKYFQLTEKLKTLIFVMNEKTYKILPQEKAVFFPFGINTRFFSYTTNNSSQETISEFNILFFIPVTKNIDDYLSFIDNIYYQFNNKSVKFHVLSAEPIFPGAYSRYFQFYSNLDSKSLLNLYKSAYLCIDLRRDLEWNNCALECLALHKPIISFPDGTIPFLKNFSNGFIIEKYDAEYIAALVTLLMNDKFFYNYIISNNRGVVENFSYEKGVEKIEAVFHSYGII